ncbi:MAG: hypothetical protein H8E32_06360 [Nitrospinae bacterium]|nr:hypothetical protein [Nitrospinota bacterium]
MNAKQSILKTLAIASMTLIASGSAFAHSDHDHSKVPFKWELSKNLHSKIERDLNSSKPSGVIGLNHFEQKKFNHYDIKVGNKFSAIVRNIDVTFERTSAGLKVTDATVFNTTMNGEILPIKKVSNISNISMQKHFHPGHDHKRLQVEWVFGETTSSKIAKKMFEGKSNPSVGLNNLEQDLLNEYGIKPGNKFELSISDHNFLVKRTSSGLIVLNHIENQNIAKADLDKNMVKDNI